MRKHMHTALLCVAFTVTGLLIWSSSCAVNWGVTHNPPVTAAHTP